MTTLDKKTLEYLIEHLTRQGEYHSGPDRQSLTVRRGGDYEDFTYYLADDIRAWLVGLIHQGHAYFLPTAAERNLKADVRTLKRSEIECACGWIDGFDIDYDAKTYDKDQRDLEMRFSAHIAEEKKKVEEMYQWDD